jgi:hypothetical protein
LFLKFCFRYIFPRRVNLVCDFKSMKQLKFICVIVNSFNLKLRFQFVTSRGFNYQKARKIEALAYIVSKAPVAIGFP